jgi:SNF2 family DNA or RNA helicase
MQFQDLKDELKEKTIEDVVTTKSGFGYQLNTGDYLQTMLRPKFKLYYMRHLTELSINEFASIIPQIIRPYQRAAIRFCLNHPASYQALDMGLGKTVVSLIWLANIMKRDPKVKGTLVMAPLRAVYSTWPEEIDKWRPDLNYTLLHGPDKAANLRQQRNIYIMNYEGLPWLWNELRAYYKKYKRMPFNTLIIDEGSMVKSTKTKRFKILKIIVKNMTSWRTILSGTPAPNSLLDLWPQYYLLDGGKRLGDTITGYKSRHFMQVDRMGFVWKLRPFQEIPIYNAVADITYRLDAKDHIDVPERINNIIKVKLNDDLMVKYKQLEKDFFTQLEDDRIEAINAMSRSMKLRQFIQGAMYDDEDADKPSDQRRVIYIHDQKLKALEELVESAAGQGILCAVQFRFELRMIKKKFPKAPIVAGGTKPADATRYFQEWNEGKIPLLICHPASLAHSVNLQRGSHIILFYGLPWSLEQYQQLIARLDRSGQRTNVIVHHLIIKGSIDERVFQALSLKIKGQADFLDFLKSNNGG